MNEIIEQLSNISWWFTVVIAGIVVNILASYIKPSLERVAEKFSKKMLLLNKEKARKYDELITRLESDKEFAQIYAIDALFERTRAVWFLVYSSMFFIMAFINESTKTFPSEPFSIVLGAFGSYGYFVSYLKVIQSSRMWGLLAKAKKLP